ncbi:MAG: PqqD family protein [Candidatus Binataceae bacterium]
MNDHPENAPVLLSSIVQATSDQMSCDLSGEAAILDFKQGVYYGLDPVGAAIWNLLAQPCKVAEIKRALLEDYEVTPRRCETDLIALLGDLAARGLIQVTNAPDR